MIKLLLIFIIVSCCIGGLFWFGYTIGRADTLEEIVNGAIKIYLQKEEDDDNVSSED